MSIKSNIQQNLILKSGQRKHRRQLVNKSFISFKDAVSVGLIADLRDQQSIKPISDFFGKVQRKDSNYKILLFVDKKREEINQYNYEKLFPGAMITIVSSGDYSIFGVPKSTITAPFVSGKFDILFRLKLRPCFELDMVLLSTQATMYAGHDHPGLSFLDFRITLAQGSSTESLCKNLLIYMAKFVPDNTESDSQDFKLF